MSAAEAPVVSVRHFPVGDYMFQTTVRTKVSSLGSQLMVPFLLEVLLVARLFWWLAVSRGIRPIFGAGRRFAI